MKTYDLKRVTFLVNGVPVTGFQDGDACVVARNADNFTKQVGADGEVCRSSQNDPSGRITLTLMYSSLSNNALGAIAALDQAFGASSVAVAIIDAKSGTQVLAPNAWIVRDPDITFGRDSGTREWILDCARLQTIHSGIPGAGGVSPL